MTSKNSTTRTPLRKWFAQLRPVHKGILLTAGAVCTATIAAQLTPEPKLDTLTVAADFDKTAPTDAFVLADATATDSDRDLIWSRCLLGQTFADGGCTGVATEFDSWQAALDAAEAQAAQGWRLPNIKELASITEDTQVLPALNVSVFPFADGLAYYSHAGTTERTDYSNYVSSSSEYPNEKCIEQGSSWSKKWVGEQSGWECQPAVIPAQYSVQANAAYLWSSTPAPFPSYVSDPVEAKDTLIYALDSSEGSIQSIRQDGQAIGGYGDTANEKRARYILLVKDASS